MKISEGRSLFEMLHILYAYTCYKVSICPMTSLSWFDDCLKRINISIQRVHNLCCCIMVCRFCHDTSSRPNAFSVEGEIKLYIQMDFIIYNWPLCYIYSNGSAGCMQVKNLGQLFRRLPNRFVKSKTTDKKGSVACRRYMLPKPPISKTESNTLESCIVNYFIPGLLRVLSSYNYYFNKDCCTLPD